jgi:hypothetical protein
VSEGHKEKLIKMLNKGINNKIGNLILVIQTDGIAAI